MKSKFLSFSFFSALILGFSSPLRAEVPKSENKSEQKAPILSEKDFLMRNYQNIAIATDLETDDVFALAILFDEANQIYSETGNFPIQLIVVGEGNGAIKKMRMEKLAQEFFSLPEGVSLRIVEGKSTKENDFIYDGQELFEKEELSVAFPQEDRSLAAAKEIENWAKTRENPFLIQLKPAEELLYIDPEIGQKISLLFYGSFNLRKTVPANGTMQEVVDQISSKFKKVAILEQYGVLGNKGRVSDENGWAHKIQEKVKRADTPFLEMVKKLMNNWNAYISNKLLGDCLAFPEIAQDEYLFSELQKLQTSWNPEDFKRLHPEIVEKIQDRQILRKLDVVGAISSSEVEFTLADVLVAMAATKGVDLFHADPVDLEVDEHRFLVPKPNASSTVLYYNLSDPELIANWFAEFLEG